jgi:hypothetical protein
VAALAMHPYDNYRIYWQATSFRLLNYGFLVLIILAADMMLFNINIVKAFCARMYNRYLNYERL